ncbi:MAG: M15 family metallopeptidase [Desulfovibrio sp.]|nr:M15 family metallopeptidase [Desulfovibrio sp.]
MLFLLAPVAAVASDDTAATRSLSLPDEGLSVLQHSTYPALPQECDAVCRIDWRCLQLSYPQISHMVSDCDGLWLVLHDGRRVRYAAAGKVRHAWVEDPWVVDVRSSMADAYPLEPERPDTPLGISPGRRRSYDLLQYFYGESPAAVKGQLQKVSLLGQHLWLAAPAAEAMRRASATLAALVATRPGLRRFLKMDGGFNWRRIAGERRLSPHAFGIAFDISATVAPYWRWSRLQPHPMQKKYPSDIVQAFENEGFIWGGKWHEYDLMHFEYRPEIICKARILQEGKGEALVP